MAVGSLVLLQVNVIDADRLSAYVLVWTLLLYLVTSGFFLSTLPRQCRLADLPEATTHRPGVVFWALVGVSVGGILAKSSSVSLIRRVLSSICT